MFRITKFVLISFIYLFTGSAQASLVTLFGNSVSFEFDSTLTGLFGSANVSGDTLYFTPTAFTATALNTAGVDMTNDTVNIKVQALNPQHQINTVSVIEKGDYFSFGNSTLVGVGGQVRAFDIENPSFDTTESIVANDAFTQTAFLQTNNWQADTILDTTSFNSGYLNITIQNLLGAISTTLGEAAFIEKKYVGLNVTAVPLPASIWLLGAALVGLISSTKRRQTI
ncbi:VPLPA-CTERM sorting domain-containing protein [Methylotuvimicrobium sp. KM1]|uniref:VPLPA-CTERM sorting domain-containing protein n=1 Tax=Methylotuvimicrobium sp. KM1 TaxID=3377707 RepID=UPI00384E00E2